METEWKLYRTGKKFTASPQLYLHLRQWYLQFRMRKEKGKEEYLYSTIYTMHSPKALRHGSHCFTCKLHYVCLSYVSVHQTAPPLTEVRDIQLQLTTHRSTPKGWKAELACLVDLYSGRFTRVSGHPSATGLSQDRESSPAKDRRSTAVPRNKQRRWSSPTASNSAFD